MVRPQHFGWFLSRGFGPHGWGHPYLDWDHRWAGPELYQQSVRTLEQAGFDLVIIEDALSLGNASTLDLRIRSAYGGPKHDPLLLAPYLFDVTQHIGIAPTVNPLAYSPYQAARQFATLQHLSDSRFGINVVTDVGSSRHFGVDPLDHDGAYDRAEEWLGALKRLWGSWGGEGLVADASTGQFADGSKLDAFSHRGEYFSFDGPLNALPFGGGDSEALSGDPIVVSPGGSPRGLGFAGANSQVQLALASLDVETVKAYRTKVLAAAAAAGRGPADIDILFVFKPIVVSSAEEAQRLVDASEHPSDEALQAIALGQSSDLETDLTTLDLDRPIDPAIFGDHVSRGTIKGLLGKFESFDGVPLRDILTAKAKLGRIASREGYVGTADEIADFIEEFGEEADNDGFIFSGDLHPVTVHRMLDELVPILRRRGILRRSYGGGGLRGNLRDF
ncbi:LLM class flavin-dependent oxidoreductase [Herbiconiux sp. KACC 21604]|uniref:LLM class flavin-dependent oxidoreductase n=1 Tax=unclassified Herbiconiux TaxID=2618217 RepID=UPI001492E3AF|nr:LLM class flavin-dependent oxidoreductase [Herbiconiux sp. SALV-R1]QJU55571.1 LLM class flavin-dependent oxidoreductase [Herbiconiux sp. SALV-R1]WPO86762.1 LLM class flavin-dependent oxidoreductase [Herbiconiux sp. KACC 21604]